MTVTDVLRRLLDERGVEWDYGIRGATTTRFNANGVDLTFTPMRDGLVCSTILTPEQAIAATLGPFNCTNDERTNGTCHTVAMDCFGNPPYNTSGLNGNSTACGCSECGAPWSTMGIFRGNQLKHNFKACPICGRKVVDG